MKTNQGLLATEESEIKKETSSHIPLRTDVNEVICLMYT